MFQGTTWQIERTIYFFCWNRERLGTMSGMSLCARGVKSDGMKVWEVVEDELARWKNDCIEVERLDMAARIWVCQYKL
jgi:hypothetical protein